MNSVNYIQILSDILESRQKKNLNYSKRALARDLGVDPGDLVKLVKGKKSVTPRIAYRIGLQLGLSGDGMVKFLHPTLS